MVERHLARRGINDPRVLAAFERVPREAFLPSGLAEFAYDDTPLPIEEGQTISQPYIVAYTVQALGLVGGERVLEVGTGSGYAAAILGSVAAEVYTVERFASLAETAAARLARLGYGNVHVVCGDGSLGLPSHAPFAAIAVAAGGPRAPAALLEQLEIGGRLVIPIGRNAENQVLTRFTRVGEDEVRQEALTEVRFVPLVGEQAWADPTAAHAPPKVSPRVSIAPARPSRDEALVSLVREEAEAFGDIDTARFDGLVDRIGDSKLVLLGEATHGTSEFYRMRARITRELVLRKGFQFVAVEADWPDAARVDEYVRGGPRRSAVAFAPFSRFPTWMWRNEEVLELATWMRAHNAERPEQRVGFHGLDLYSMFTSIAVVLEYLDRVDPPAASVARHRYGGLTPWQRDPAAYGEAVLVGRYESSEHAVVAMLKDMLARRLDYAQRDGERFFDAAQNARLVADAERYYRAMYYGSVASWNLRDTHMFETLRSLFAYYGPEAKGVVWEHNSHVGDAAATEMGTRGELNVGQLCREAFGDRAYAVGFGTDHGTVAAAEGWGAPMQRMRIVPAREGSYEQLFHRAGVPAFLLHLRTPRRRALRDELAVGRLERAIGVVYRPRTELASHYFQARLPQQFDEYVWLDETNAVRPLPEGAPRERVPETYPFGA